MIICGDEADSDAVATDAAHVAETAGWVAEMNSRGVRKLGSRLRPARSATTVRSRAGNVVVSDGPFAETKEQMLGFDLLDCADLDEALEVARRHPWVKYGSIELRPLWPD